ncbi:MAG: hypothetical protein LBF12_07490 [Christensenellaceae bacterium]|jgi:hypothetical protein|nr:hypothetical protein [Christensenellaceae bacterium]
MRKKIFYISVSLVLIIATLFSFFGCKKPVEEETHEIIEQNGEIRIIDKIDNKNLLEFKYNLETGRYSYLNNNVYVLSNATAEAKNGDTLFELKNYPNANRSKTIEKITDEFGHGVMLTVKSAAPDSPNFIQNFKLYDGVPYILFSLTLESTNNQEIVSNYSAPLILDSDSPFTKADKKVGSINVMYDENLFYGVDDLYYTNVIRMPFDNDNFIEYEDSQYTKLGSYEFSSEVAVFYSEETRKTFLFGSIDHTTYKSGIDIRKEDATKPFSDVKLYSGAANAITHDLHYAEDQNLENRTLIPHGYVSGERVPSAQMVMAGFDDYITALETYGDLNAVVQPALEWDLGVPTGWMSWGAYGMDLTFDRIISNSEFMRDELSDFNNNGITYINTDSYTSLGEYDLFDVASSVLENGQTPGIYDTPYSYWSPNVDKLGQFNPATGGKYTYYEMVIKDAEGNPIRLGKTKDTGRMVYDPTHPGTKMMIDAKYKKIIDAGYGYIKLDFITDSALEGQFYDSSVTTGIQAYNYAMNYVKTLLSKENTGRDIFISTSISPIFPGGYAHARRISCDAFGSIKESRYMLNSLTYGWWLGGRIYAYNDPDHTVLYKYYGNEDVPDQLYNEVEAATRYNASIIAGSVLLLSDDFELEGAKARAKGIVDNKDLLEVALIGKSFKPLNFMSDNVLERIFYKAANVYYLKHNGKTYLALFNYSDKLSSTITINLTKLGYEATDLQQYSLKSLNDGSMINSTHVFSITLPKYASQIYEVVG